MLLLFLQSGVDDLGFAVEGSSWNEEDGQEEEHEDKMLMIIVSSRHNRAGRVMRKWLIHATIKYIVILFLQLLNLFVFFLVLLLLLFTLLLVLLLVCSIFK